MEEAEPENLDIDELWARDLRAKLLYWRLSEGFVPTTVDTKLRGRTRELFMSLLSLGEFTDCKEKVERFALEHQKARKMELLDQLKAAIVDIISNMEDTSADGKVQVSEIKEKLDERGLDISSSYIGRNLSNLDIPRKNSNRGRFVDLTDAHIIKKLEYWRQKYGLTKEADAEASEGVKLSEGKQLHIEKGLFLEKKRGEGLDEGKE